MGLQTAIIDWLDARFDLTDAADAELYRRVPNYAAAAHRYLGGVAAFLVAIEFITGFLLGLYYVPDGAGNPAPAYASVVSSSRPRTSDGSYAGYISGAPTF